MKATRHNGRSGKHGTYDAKHNDRRFDVENSEHIDAERKQAVLDGLVMKIEDVNAVIEEAVSRKVRQSPET